MTPAPLRPVAQPLHRQLRDLMMARIDAGDWGPGTYLPPETRLAEEYGVAVGTLRKALLDMAALKGSWCADRARALWSPAMTATRCCSASSTCAAATAPPCAPKAACLSRIQRAATGAEAQALALPPAAPVICITRVRDGDGTPIIYEHIVLSADRFGRLLTAPEVLPNTLYQLYQTDFAATVHRAREQISVGLAEPECARELDVRAGTGLLHIRRVALDYTDAPIELRVSWVNTAQVVYEAVV
jgi:GntR family transcriptional regulator